MPGSRIDEVIAVKVPEIDAHMAFVRKAPPNEFAADGKAANTMRSVDMDVGRNSRRDQVERADRCGLAETACTKIRVLRPPRIECLHNDEVQTRRIGHVAAGLPTFHHCSVIAYNSLGAHIGRERTAEIKVSMTSQLCCHGAGCPKT